MVSQPALSQVLVFDSLGQLSATLGRRGDGPGEFRDLLSIGTLGDTLYVTDRGRQRVTYFRDGQLLGSRRWIADVAPRFAGNSGLRLHPNVPEVIVGENRALVRPNLAMSAPETEREVSVRKLESEPIPLSDSRIRRAVLDMWVFPEPPEGKEEPIRAAFEKEFRGSQFLPEYFPPVTDLFVGQDGSIWLRREETEGEMIDYSVLWGDGAPRGTVAIPALQRVVAARDGVMVAVEVDELGIPTLVRYSVQH